MLSRDFRMIQSAFEISKQSELPRWKLGAVIAKG